MEVKIVEHHKPFELSYIETLIGKKVLITFSDGEKVESNVKEMTLPWNNPDDKWSLMLNEFEVDEDEIETIQIINT